MICHQLDSSLKFGRTMSRSLPECKDEKSMIIRNPTSFVWDNGITDRQIEIDMSIDSQIGVAFVLKPKDDDKQRNEVCTYI